MLRAFRIVGALDGRRQRMTHTRTVWNYKLLAWTLAGLCVLAVAGYFWHGYQVDRLAESFLTRADQLEEKKDWAGASNNVLRYVQLRRGTAEGQQAQVRWAKLVDQTAKDGFAKTRAVSQLYQAIGVASPEEANELRALLAQTLLELGRYAEAERVSSEALQAEDGSPRASRAYALALAGQVHNRKLTGKRPATITLGEELQQALDLNEGDVELTMALAELYRDLPELLSALQREEAATSMDRTVRADLLVDKMVQRNPTNSAAYLARHVYREKYDKKLAGSDLAKVLELDPESVPGRLTVARHEAQLGTAESREKAEAHYRYIVEKLAPKNEAAWAELGDVQLAAGEREKAVESWRAGLGAIGIDNFMLAGRLVSTLTDLGQLDEAQKYLQTLDRIVAATSIATDVGLRRNREQDRDLLRSAWALRAGEQRREPKLIRDAVGTLQELTQGPRRNSTDAWMLLGAARVALRDWEAAAAAYDRAFSLNSQLLFARRSAASSWLAAGNPSEALRRYEELVGTKDDREAAEISIAIAFARLQQQTRLAPNQRNWEPFETAIAKSEQLVAKTTVADAWQLPVLAAERLLLERESLARGSSADDPAGAKMRDAALARLADAESKYAGNPDLFDRLVLIYERLGEPLKADRALARCQELQGETLELIVAKSRLAALRGDFAQAEQILNDAKSRQPAEKHRALQRALVGIASARRDESLIRRELVELQRLSPQDADVMFQLAEMAIIQDDLTGAKNWETKLHELEGDDGHLWKFVQARRLLAPIKDRKDPGLTEIERIVESIRVARPTWPAAEVLRGYLAEKRADKASAAEAYRRAIDLGERNPLVIKQLVLLLQDNLPEAERYLAMMNDPAGTSRDLAGLQISLAERKGEFDRAVALARAEVKRRPDSGPAQLWLGQILLNSYRVDSPDAAAIRDEALAAFRRSFELQPENLPAWSGLLLYYLRTKQPDEIRRTIDLVQDFKSLNLAQRADIQAQAYELSGDRATAEEKYREALKLEPKNAEVHLRYGRFLVREKPEAAQREMREAVRLAPDYALARRELAALLVMRGGEEEWQQANELLKADQNPNSERESLRMQATLLVQRRGAENLARAKAILEKLTAGADVNPTDRIALAKLYELEGQQPSATSQYRVLVARDDATAIHLAEFINYLIRQQTWGEADTWLKRLEQSNPLSLAPVQLRVRWLQGTGKSEQVDALIDAYFKRIEVALTDSERKGRALASMGDLLMIADRKSSAEPWYRRALETAPEQFPGLAVCLAHLNRKREALDVCLAALESQANSRPIVVACDILMLGEPNSDDFIHAEPLLAKALAKHGSDPLVLSSVANVRFFQKRTDEAQQLYLRVIELDSKNVIARNNLATMLGEDPMQAPRALKFIEEALQIAGPQPPLLDTMGTILLQMGQAEKAAEVLERSVKSLDPDPRFLFHLAFAYHRLGQTEKSQSIMKRAKLAGLERFVLTESDRKYLKELQTSSGT